MFDFSTCTFHFIGHYFSWTSFPYIAVVSHFTHKLVYFLSVSRWHHIFFSFIFLLMDLLSSYLTQNPKYYVSVWFKKNLSMLYLGTFFFILFRVNSSLCTWYFQYHFVKIKTSSMTWSIPRCPPQSHFQVYCKNNSYFVGVGLICDVELTCAFWPFFSFVRCIKDMSQYYKITF